MLDMKTGKPELNAKVELSVVIPGDRLATIEEFEAGSGSTTKGETIVASRVGVAHPDMAKRIMFVMPSKQAARIPQVGNYVIGTVESASSTVAQVSIKAIDEVESNKEFTAMLSLREDRRRRSPPLKGNDLIRAKVISTENSIFQLSLDCEKCGAIFTVCSVCGGSVISLGHDRIKCRECGTIDERLLSTDFAEYSRAMDSA